MQTIESKQSNIDLWIEEFFAKIGDSTFDDVLFEDEYFYSLSWIECAEHSLKKWRGLLPENVSKYDLVLDHQCRNLYDPENLGSMSIDDATCALCIKADYTECGSCPIRLMRGHSCDHNPLSKDLSEYECFLKTGDPVPMINLLEETVKFIKDGGMKNHAE